MSAPSPSESPFAGFPPGALGFYAGLEDRQHVRRTGPTTRPSGRPRSADRCSPSLDALEAEFGEAQALPPQPRRPFSADRSPYKTHLGAVRRPRSVAWLLRGGERDGPQGGRRLPCALDVRRRRACARAVDDDRTGLRARPPSSMPCGASGFDVRRGEGAARPPGGMPPTTRASRRSATRSSWSSATSATRTGSARSAR